MAEKGEYLQRSLWFGAGCVLGGLLSLSYDAVRFVPMGVVFGLLCFGCGIVLMQFLALRKEQKKVLDEEAHWLTEYLELEEQKSVWMAEKEKWEEEKHGKQKGEPNQSVSQMSRPEGIRNELV